MMQQIISNTHSPRPSGLVAQAIEQRCSIHVYSERSWVQFPTWSELIYVLIILAVQQKFGLSVVNETLESTLSMAMEAVSLYMENR